MNGCQVLKHISANLLCMDEEGFNLSMSRAQVKSSFAKRNKKI